MIKAKHRKAILLFEVMIVALFIAIASTFMFRSYAIFLKIGRKSTQYLTMINNIERISFDIALAESEGLLPADFTKNIQLGDDYVCDITLEDTEFENLKKSKIKIEAKKKKVSFDSVLYISSQ